MNNPGDYVLGMDLGTGSAKCVVMNAAGHVCGSGSSSYPTSHPAPGLAEQDPEQWYQAVVSATRSATEESNVPADHIKCIGICGAAHIPVLLDDRDRVLRPAILWSDQRSGNEVEYLVEHHGDQLLSTCSNQASCTWTLPQLMWLKRNEPEVIAKCRKLLLTKDYLIFRFTGEHATDVGTAASALLMHAQSNTWCDELVDLSGLPRSAMPAIFAPTDFVGELRRAAASDLGLMEGTPMVAGSLDTAAELLGLGAIRPGQAVLRLGTAGGINVVTRQPDPSPMTLTYPQAYGQLWYSQAGTNSCGNAIRWVIDLLGTDTDSFTPADLDLLADRSAPGCDGLMFHPYLLGERAPYWDPELKASFTGVAIHHGKAHFVRAVQEGIAFSLRDCCLMMDQLGLEVREVKMAGGGSECPRWSQIISNVVNLPIQTTQGGDSVVGAALLASLAMKYFANVEQAVESTVVADRMIEPDRALTGQYARLFDDYKQIHDVLAPVYHGRKD